MPKNSKLCLKCKWHGYIGHNGEWEEVYCNYASLNYTTCKKRDGTDIRGDDPDSCLLFAEGDKVKKKYQNPAWRSWRSWKGRT